VAIPVRRKLAVNKCRNCPEECKTYDNRVKERVLAWTSSQKSLSAWVNKRKKTMKKIQMAIMAVALVIAAQAQASFFDITFTDGGNNVGNGVLTATDNGNGTWNVTAASFTVTAGAASGNYSLVPNPNAPNPVNSGTYANMYYTYDNQATYPGTPYLNANGLLLSSGGATPSILGIWGNSSTDYEFAGTVYPYPNYPGTVDVHGIVTLTPSAVPEPTTMIAGALLLLPFGASTLRMLRRRTA
jgi:hypothetical protein